MFISRADHKTEIVQARWSVSVPERRQCQCLFGEGDGPVKVGRISTVRISGAQADPEVVEQPERLRCSRWCQGHRLLLELDGRIEIRGVGPLVVSGPEADSEVSEQASPFVRGHPSDG